MSDQLIVEASGERDLFPCPDCGKWLRQVWGFISTANEVDRSEMALAVYYLRWTEGHRERGVTVLLSVGGWGDNPRRKVCIGLQRFLERDIAGYRFIDARDTPWLESPDASASLGEPLAIAQVLNTPYTREALRIMAALEQSDPRYRAFLATVA